MTIGIMWRPTDEKNSHLNVPAPSQFMDMMRDAGFPIPCTLNDDDLPVMRAMAVVFGRNDKDVPNPFREIVDLIVAYNSIDLYPTA